MKRILLPILVIGILLLLLLPLILLSTPGCNSSLRESPPASPITVEVSFPNGAPPLNKEAELTCIIKPQCILKNMSIEIRLPEGFELVSGDLSWFGDISSGDDLEVIRANVRAVKTGNWTIESRWAINPEEQSGVSLVPGWIPRIYVSVSEDSAEWGITPPWYKDSGEVPVHPVDTKN